MIESTRNLGDVIFTAIGVLSSTTGNDSIQRDLARVAEYLNQFGMLDSCLSIDHNSPNGCDNPDCFKFST